MNSICYFGHDLTAYSLKSGTPDCYVTKGSDAIATFETLSLRGNGKVLHIDHFAVRSSQIGKGRGEIVLRGFAQVVAEQLPGVNQISFELYRALPGSDIENLAEARSRLLKGIGALDVNKSRPNNRCICVSGVWDKAHWRKADEPPALR